MANKLILIIQMLPRKGFILKAVDDLSVVCLYLIETN